VTVNGTQYSTSYGSGSTPTSLASALAGVISANSTLVTASPSGAGINLTAKTTGFNTNYSLSSGSSTSQSATFSQPSFSVSVSGATMTGGNNAGPTVYDSGTIWVMVNGTQYSTAYNSGSTTSSLASTLASVISSNSSFVTASSSGAIISLTATSAGASTNYSLSSGSSTSQPATFSPSFTVSVSGSSLTGGANATAPSLSTPSVTRYTYDALSNLACVVQKNVDTSAFTSCASAPAAWRPRSFVYDSLSRLRSANNPESGTITYTYDNDGNVQTKADARGIQTTFSYDPLDRLNGKAYSNGDPSVGYTYDAAACLGAPACSNIGRRTGMTDAAGTESWSYDAMGRPLADQRTTNGITKTTAYSYNFDGSLSTLSYLSGRTITYTPNSAGRIVSAIDSANSISYATNALYAPQGSLSSLQNGSSIVSTFYFNNRLQPCRISVKSTGNSPGSCTDSANLGNILDYSYNFSLGAGDNGNATSITNNRDNTRSQSFIYDALNRLVSAQTQTTGVTIPNSNCWGLNYGYDAWGNLLYSTFTGPSGCGQPVPLNVSATTSNQIAGYCYDVAGNLLDQGPCPTTGSHSYAYNAENQMISAAGVSYVYDGDEKRVKKSTNKLYWYGTGSDPLDETDTSGNLLEEYILFNGQRIARRDPSNTVMYYFADHLGSARVTTSANGSILDDSDFYPFGGERANISTSSPTNNYKFTGKERDSESGLDDFDARYYSSSMGRFLSPDWAESPDPVPYADLTNPQTLNLYGYVKNNPLRFTDPTGHSGDDDIVDHILNFVVSAGVTFLSDNLFGVGRPQPKSPEGQFGQAVGDFAAQQSGIAEAEAGTAGLASAPETAMVPEVGPEGAALQAVVSEAGVLHGTATAAIATVNLAKDAQQTSSGGPKAKDAPGVSAGGQATDEHGNKLGPSGDTQVNRTRSNTREGANNRARDQGSRTVEHRNPKQGKPHFHPAGKNGKKKPSSTHHEYPD